MIHGSWPISPAFIRMPEEETSKLLLMKVFDRDRNVKLDNVTLRYEVIYIPV